jgi:hypothetical protein
VVTHPGNLVTQAKHAQNIGAVAIIITLLSDLKPPPAWPTTDATGIQIPVFTVTRTDGESLKRVLKVGHRLKLMITAPDATSPLHGDADELSAQLRAYRDAPGVEHEYRIRDGLIDTRGMDAAPQTPWADQ